MRRLSFITTSLMGAGLAFILDPISGHRRRAKSRDKLIHYWKMLKRAADVTSRDVAHRASGLVADTKSILRDEKVSDDVLVERVASQIGRAVSHPSAIDIVAENGWITLKGPILEKEVPGLLERAAATRGVIGVENQLIPYKEADGIPALQGPGRLVAPTRWNFQQRHWSPATRLGGMTLGGALTGFSLLSNKSPILRMVAGAFGLSLTARSITNLPLKRITGIRAGRRAVDIQKTITVNSPVYRVYDYWANFTNFPYFMSNVLEVKDLGNGRSHWEVQGPAGIPVAWDATLTKVVPNEMIAWRSEPGSAVKSAGMVNFFANEDGSTTVGIKMSYNPPVGALGHALASVFGMDPKHKMDDDLMRMKTFLETGVIARDAAKGEQAQARLIH